MDSRKKILVIEDHRAIRIVLENILSKQYLPVTTSNGIEALAWMAKGNIPDLILLDINLPKLNGIQFLKNIRSSGFFQKIPVYIISGENENEIVNQCLDLNIIGFITKPFNPIELQKKINTLFKTNQTVLQ